MKSSLITLLAGFALSALFSTAPAFAKDKETKADSEAVAPENDKDAKKNVTVFVLEAKPEAAHAAALEALASVGAKVKKDAPDSIEAKRSNKVGIAVGSGGEKIFVAIKALADGKTEVTVTTKKTMAGYLGQKLWNEEVATHIRGAIK